MSTLAVIPARGGSKRIPRKNIREFCGRPMLAWSIEAARKSGCFDRIIVSTDDTEIAGIARNHGAETPFLRPADLSDDYTGTIPVIAHATSEMRKQGMDVRQVCCLYPTAPFVRASDIKSGLNLLAREQADYVLSVTSFPYPIQRALRVTSTGRLAMFDQEKFDQRSQDLEEAWHDAGQFYWGTADAWLEGIPVFGPGSVPFILPSYRVQDIDTPDDWVRAELMFRALSDSQWQ